MVLKATHEASQRPLKSTVLAQKALQGSETETRELLRGMEENSVSPKRVIDLSSRQIMICFNKRGTEKS